MRTGKRFSQTRNTISAVKGEQSGPSVGHFGNAMVRWVNTSAVAAVRYCFPQTLSTTQVLGGPASMNRPVLMESKKSRTTVLACEGRKSSVTNANPIWVISLLMGQNLLGYVTVSTRHRLNLSRKTEISIFQVGLAVLICSISWQIILFLRLWGYGLF